jgi:hypothetical protein
MARQHYARQRTGIVWLLILGFSPSPPPAAQSPEEVNRAVQRGVDYLKSRQRRDGSWPGYENYPGGTTALVTLALLSCDVPTDDPRIALALAHLRRIEPSQTYVVALQTMVFAEATPKADAPLIRRNVRWLIGASNAGRWSYTAGGVGFADNSNTQFALLGLWAAAEAGFEIPERFWDVCRNHWIGAQSEIGSWDYAGRGARGSMSVAGISSLVITSRQSKTVREGMYKGQRCRCNGPVQNVPLERGLAWLGRNFRADQHPGGGMEWHYYYLYGVERAGRLTGRRFFGNHDWYREGVRFLLSQQQLAGDWPGGQNGLANTAFALLFLSKGKIPILVNKLEYGSSDDWNNSPNDVHNLTRFMAKKWNVKLNWQLVDVRAAGVTDLLQAPVLQFSGHAAPQFSDREKKLLREYVEQGGILMVDANCGIRDFDRGFRDLCQELFPEPSQELRRLEPSHGVWTSLFDLRQLAENWPLFGINLGCRTAVFFSPEDLSCRWEHQDEQASVPAFQIGANIIAYATGPESLTDKLEERKVFKDAPEDTIRRGYLQIAKIKHSGDWNPAPRAIRNLMVSVRDVAKINVILQQRDIDVLDPNLSNYPLAYMHGRTRFVFSAREKDILAAYLRNGAVLFADACCGSERFDEAFRALVKDLFPQANLEPIPLDHELYSDRIGYDISKVRFGKALGGRESAPLLEGVKLDGRYAIIYSKYDLGCALERQQATDCKGYEHDSALRIASNIVLYAIVQ